MGQKEAFVVFVAAMVGVWYTSGHEVVQQVRPTREPDGTTSGLAFATTPQVVSFLLSSRSLPRTYLPSPFSYVPDDTCKDVIASLGSRTVCVQTDRDNRGN